MQSEMDLATRFGLMESFVLDALADLATKLSNVLSTSRLFLLVEPHAGGRRIYGSSGLCRSFLNRHLLPDGSEVGDHVQSMRDFDERIEESHWFPSSILSGPMRSSETPIRSLPLKRKSSISREGAGDSCSSSQNKIQRLSTVYSRNTHAFQVENAGANSSIEVKPNFAHDEDDCIIVPDASNEGPKISNHSNHLVVKTYANVDRHSPATQERPHCSRESHGPLESLGKIESARRSLLGFLDRNERASALRNSADPSIFVKNSIMYKQLVSLIWEYSKECSKLLPRNEKCDSQFIDFSFDHFWKFFPAFEIFDDGRTLLNVGPKFRNPRGFFRAKFCSNMRDHTRRVNRW